jgi:hypothetical protein
MGLFLPFLKYLERACSDNQHVFIPFVFYTFGFLASCYEYFLQRVMHSNVVSPNFLNLIFKSINFVIKKELAVQFVVYLPYIQV